MNVKINKQSNQHNDKSPTKTVVRKLDNNLINSNNLKNKSSVTTSKIIENYLKSKIGIAKGNNCEDEVILKKDIFTEKKEIMKNNILILNKENQLRELKLNLRIKGQKENINANKTQIKNIKSSNLIKVDKVQKKEKTFTSTVYDNLNTSGDNKENLNAKSSYRNLVPIDTTIKRRDISMNQRKPQLYKSNFKNPFTSDSDRKEKSIPFIDKNKMKREDTNNNVSRSGIILTPSNKNNQNDEFVAPIKATKNNLKVFNLARIADEINKSKEDSEFFDYEDEKREELTNDERMTYGLREPKDYKKIKLLGKGGCGIVWLCEDSKGNEYAVKQISKRNKSDSLREITTSSKIAKREIDILNCLNSKTSELEENHMISLIDYVEDASDIWLIFEKGGKSLSNLTFKIKGEFLLNERIYSIKKGKFLVHLFKDINNLKSFIRKLLNFIKFINESQIVHCDIKPENILIEYAYTEDNQFVIKNLKVIDFGSSFFINNPDNFCSNTPEYMSPEITELIERNASGKDVTNFLKNLKQWPWCIDIWSLGVTVLELILSCPLWMSYKAKVVIHGRTIYKTGLFGVKGRSGAKIHTKQIEVANSVRKLMNECLIKDEKDKNSLADLLTQMLDLNYKTRISPENALNHPFLIIE